MSKEIQNHFAMVDILRKATSYFVGSFTLELIKRRKEWENPETKTEFVESFYQEYFAWDEQCSISTIRNRVNCVIRIIEAHRVEDALQYVIDSNNKKMDILQAKTNAQETLELIRSGKMPY